MIGYVAMRRDWQDHDIFEGDTFSRRDAWAWLIANAAWKGTKARIKGSSVILARGELTFSVRFLAEKWGWSKSAVDRFLHLLRAEGMIEVRTKIGTAAGTTAGQQPGHPAGQGQSIISICNYEKYQQPPRQQRDNDRDDDGAEGGTTTGTKKNQYNQNIPEPNGSGADPEKLVFDYGIALLRKAGKTETQARAILGKWRRDYGAGGVIEAMARAQREGAIEPVSFIEGCLRAHRKAQTYDRDRITV